MAQGHRGGEDRRLGIQRLALGCGRGVVQVGVNRVWEKSMAPRSTQRA